MASVLVPLASGCEELEAVTVIDLLVRAGINVVSAGLNKDPVTCSRGVVIIPDMDLDTALEQDYDMVVLPGGLPGADHLNEDPRIQSLIKRMHENDQYVAAICAAPKVLASAGLLEHKQATSFPGVLDSLNIPGLKYQQKSVVTDGRIITSRGPGTAMDFTLHLIELLVGVDKRLQVESALQRSS